MAHHHPPGFRFYPTEEELVSFYLRNKLQGLGLMEIDRIIPSVDVYDYNPSDLPRFAGEGSGGDEEQWFFFVPRQERVARGGRPNRLTAQGYWKATGSPSLVYSQDRVIGRKRTMVFYEGRAPNGKKTVWKMNEYKVTELSEAEAFSSDAANPEKNPQIMQTCEELSLCRIYKSSKTVRAFDRRPPPDEMVERHQMALASHQYQYVATTSQQNPSVEANIYFFNNSSSEGHEYHIANPATSHDHESVETANSNYNSNLNPEMAVEEDGPSSFWPEWFDYADF